MDIAKEIKKIIIDENLTLSALAVRLGTSQQNLSAKLKRNNFSVKEMKDIAKVLGYEVDIKFVKN